MNLVFLTVCLHLGHALFPYGTSSGDTKISGQNSSVVSLSPLFQYYGKYYGTFKIFNDGLITLGCDCDEMSAHTFDESVVEVPLIAPWLARINAKIPNSQVTYRLTAEETILRNLSDFARNYEDFAQDFMPQYAMIVTWENVGTDSYDPDTFDKIIFYNGDTTNFYSLPVSKSPRLFDIISDSNVNHPGLYAFRVDVTPMNLTRLAPASAAIAMTTSFYEYSSSDGVDIAGTFSTLADIASHTFPHTYVTAVALISSEILVSSTNDITIKTDIETTTTIDTEMTITSGIATEIRSSSGLATEINTTSSLATEINTSSSLATEINTSSSLATEIRSSSGLATEINTTSSLDTEINTSSSLATEINTSSSLATEINTSTSLATEINTSSSLATEINTSSSLATEINTSTSLATEINTSTSLATEINTSSSLATEIISTSTIATEMRITPTITTGIWATSEIPIETKVTTENLATSTLSGSSITALLNAVSNLILLNMTLEPTHSSASENNTSSLHQTADSTNSFNSVMTSNLSSFLLSSRIYQSVPTINTLSSLASSLLYTSSLDAIYSSSSVLSSFSLYQILLNTNSFSSALTTYSSTSVLNYLDQTEPVLISVILSYSSSSVLSSHSLDQNVLNTNSFSSAAASYASSRELVISSSDQTAGCCTHSSGPRLTSSATPTADFVFPVAVQSSASETITGNAAQQFSQPHASATQFSATLTYSTTDPTTVTCATGCSITQSTSVGDVIQTAGQAIPNTNQDVVIGASTSVCSAVLIAVILIVVFVWRKSGKNKVASINDDQNEKSHNDKDVVVSRMYPPTSHMLDDSSTSSVDSGSRTSSTQPFIK
ncbi:hypothetical protein Btru_022404 [Bulinus truncatus]|nr:hypothetical protein Btru_022404 [Bulinus truncatus]